MKRLALAALLLLPGFALADDAPPVKDWSNEVVVVTVQKPGPALWHIAKNGSEVWLLGVVTPMPDRLKWNSDAIEAAITGANQVYLEPQLTAGLIETSWFLLTGLHKLKLQDGNTLLTALPPDLRARYAAWLMRLEKDADTDSEYLPAVAALDLEGMFRKKYVLEDTPDKRIERIADKADVPSKPLASYEAMPLVNEVQSLSAAAETSCMRDALDDIDVQSTHAEAAARAWAVGDLAGIKANYSEAKLYQCFGELKSFARDRDQVTADTLKAVDEALAKPGKSLIVVSIGALLRKDGLLDRLGQRGIVVEGPPG